VIYTVTKDGKLLWHKHRGFRDGTTQWAGNKEVGKRLGQFPTALRADVGNSVRSEQRLRTRQKPKR
jgi:hypothetical protein